MIDQSRSSDGRRRKVLRGAALLQFALASPCAFCAVLFLLFAPPGHDELGLTPYMDPAIAASSAVATVLLVYGGWLAWRAAERWWVPGVLAILGTPVVAAVIFMVVLAQ